MTNGGEQVRLAQAGVSVDEQGVIVLAGSHCDGLCGRMGEPVGGSHDKGIKGIFLIRIQIISKLMLLSGDSFTYSSPSSTTMILISTGKPIVFSKPLLSRVRYFG